MSLTTTTTLPAPIQASFNKRLLAVPTPDFIFAIPAMAMTMERNGGTTQRWRRYNPLNPALVPLGNSGQTPPGQNLTAVDRHYVHIKSWVIDLESEVALS
jgi:hypothetical protein